MLVHIKLHLGYTVATYVLGITSFIVLCHAYMHTVFIRIKAGLKYTQELKYTPGSAAE